MNLMIDEKEDKTEFQVRIETLKSRRLCRPHTHRHECSSLMSITQATFIIFCLTRNHYYFYSIESVTGRFNFVYYNFPCVCASALGCVCLCVRISPSSRDVNETATQAIPMICWHTHNWEIETAIMAVASNNFRKWSKFPGRIPLTAKNIFVSKLMSKLKLSVSAVNLNPSRLAVIQFLHLWCHGASVPVPPERIKLIM